MKKLIFPLLLFLLITSMLFAQTEMKLKRFYTALTLAATGGSSIVISSGDTVYAGAAVNVNLQRFNGYISGWFKPDTAGQGAGVLDSLCLYYKCFTYNVDSTAYEGVNWRRAYLSVDGTTWIRYLTSFHQLEYEVWFDLVPASIEKMQIRIGAASADDSAIVNGELLLGWR